MGDTSSTNSAGQVEINEFRDDPFDAYYTTEYVKRLFAEWQYIYAKLINQGGSVVLTASALVDHDRGVEYSTEIGNSFHCDLIDLAEKLKKLSKAEVQALFAYAEGMSSDQVAPLLGAKGGVTIRKRQSRAVHKATDLMNGER